MTNLTAFEVLARRRADEFALPGAENHYPPDLEIEPSHLDIDLAFDLPAETVAGTVTLALRARRAGPTRLELNAVAFEDVAVRDLDGRQLTWTYDGRVIAVEWAEPFGAGEERRLAVAYRVSHPASGLYFSQPSSAYPNAPLFAMTDNETERARHWLPCVDLPNARQRLDFHLRAASDLTVLANGGLVGEEEHGDGTKTSHWRLDFPCPSYLTCIAVGDFTRADDGESDGVPIAYFAPREFTVDDLRRSFGRTGEMLSWMTRKLDMPLPYPKYYQVAATGFGGAMENISLVTWDDVFVMDETLAREWTRLVDEINLHEMAHSYFGDAVVVRDYAHAWLKESWATYMEQVWFGETRSEDERRYQYHRDARSYFAEADGRYKRPVVTRQFASSWELYDAHLYPGGACRLHTVACELGQETFWAAVRDYLKRYCGSVVETDDFRRVLEEHSGRSLGRLFDQWFHTPGYPQVKVTFRYDAKRKEGTFEITQTQVQEGKGEKDAKASVPAFALRTDVGWTIDGTHHTHPVVMDGPRATVIVPMEKDPEMVRFDPEGKVLHKLEMSPGDEKLRRQLTDAPDVSGRILAAEELAKTGTRKNIEAVAAAFRTERFWGVRADMARVLGESKADAAIEALVELVAEESDPMVLEHVIRALGQYRDPRVRQALEARLDAGVGLYRAEAAAYEALGAQRAGAPIERLIEAAGRDGFGGHAQSGALRALGATRQDAAIPALLERAAPGATSNRARPAALVGLGAFARLRERGERERLVEALVDLLRDPFLRVRQTAMAVLESAGAPEAVPALEAYRAPLSVQEQVRVDKAVRRIRAAATPKGAEGEKQVEELRDTVRKLTSRIEALEARSKADDAANGADGSARNGAGGDHDDKGSRKAMGKSKDKGKEKKEKKKKKTVEKGA